MSDKSDIKPKCLSVVGLSDFGATFKPKLGQSRFSAQTALLIVCNFKVNLGHGSRFKANLGHGSRFKVNLGHGRFGIQRIKRKHQRHSCVTLCIYSWNISAIFWFMKMGSCGYLVLHFALARSSYPWFVIKKRHYADGVMSFFLSRPILTPPGITEHHEKKFI